MTDKLPAPLTLAEYAIVQTCATTIITNVIKTIYHALTCANALVVKMKVKVKIMNLTEIMNTIPLRRLPVKFICFSFVLKIVLILLHFDQLLTVLVEIKITWIKELVTFAKIPYYYCCLNIY